MLPYVLHFLFFFYKLKVLGLLRTCKLNKFPVLVSRAGLYINNGEFLLFFLSFQPLQPLSWQICHVP